MMELTLLEFIALVVLGLFTILNSFLITIIYTLIRTRKQEWVISGLTELLRYAIIECVNGEKRFRLNSRSYTLDTWLNVILSHYYAVDIVAPKEKERIQNNVMKSIRASGILDWSPDTPKDIEFTIEALIDDLNTMREDRTKTLR